MRFVVLISWVGWMTWSWHFGYEGPFEMRIPASSGECLANCVDCLYSGLHTEIWAVIFIYLSWIYLFCACPVTLSLCSTASAWAASPLVLRDTALECGQLGPTLGSGDPITLREWLPPPAVFLKSSHFDWSLLPRVLASYSVITDSIRAR